MGFAEWNNLKRVNTLALISRARSGHGGTRMVKIRMGEIKKEVLLV